MLGSELFFLVFPRIIRRFSIPDNSWPSWTKSQPCKPQQLDFARLGFRFGLPDTAGILLGPGLRCRHASRFLGDRNFSTFSIRGASPLQLGESALENNSCFGSPISRIWVLSNPDTNKTCSNSLGTPDTFGLVSWISRFSMEMGIDGSQC